MVVPIGAEETIQGIQFPNKLFANLETDVAQAKLQPKLSTIYPNSSTSILEPWFSRWALLTTGMALIVTNTIWRNAGFRVGAFTSRANRSAREAAIKELTIEVRKIFPDARRGESWFVHDRLSRRHKARNITEGDWEGEEEG